MLYLEQFVTIHFLYKVVLNKSSLTLADGKVRISVPQKTQFQKHSRTNQVIEELKPNICKN